MQQHPQVPVADPQRRAHLIGRQAIHVAQQQRLALGGGELIQAQAGLTGQLLGDQPILPPRPRRPAATPKLRLGRTGRITPTLDPSGSPRLDALVWQPTVSG